MKALLLLLVFPPILTSERNIPHHYKVLIEASDHERKISHDVLEARLKVIERRLVSLVPYFEDDAPYDALSKERDKVHEDFKMLADVVNNLKTHISKKDT